MLAPRVVQIDDEGPVVPPRERADAAAHSARPPGAMATPLDDCWSRGARGGHRATLEAEFLGCGWGTHVGELAQIGAQPARPFSVASAQPTTTRKPSS